MPYVWHQGNLSGARQRRAATAELTWNYGTNWLFPFSIDTAPHKRFFLLCLQRWEDESYVCILNPVNFILIAFQSILMWQNFSVWACSSCLQSNENCCQGKAYPPTPLPEYLNPSHFLFLLLSELTADTWNYNQIASVLWKGYQLLFCTICTSSVLVQCF